MLESLPDVTPVAALVAGALLLAFGRRLFWLFVGVIGFVVALRVAAAYLEGAHAGWLLALVVGALGAMAAVLVQKLAVTLAGFAVGAVGLLWLAEELGWSAGVLLLAAAVLAGIAGALLVRSLFELGLVALSSLVGAALVVEGLGMESASGPLFVILAVVGIAIQLAGRRRRRRVEQ